MRLEQALQVVLYVELIEAGISRSVGLLDKRKPNIPQTSTPTLS